MCSLHPTFDTNVIAFQKNSYGETLFFHTNSDTLPVLFFAVSCFRAVKYSMSYPEVQPKQNSLLFHATWSVIWPVEKQNLHKPLIEGVNTKQSQCGDPGRRKDEKRGKSRVIQIKTAPDWLRRPHLRSDWLEPTARVIWTNHGHVKTKCDQMVNRFKDSITLLCFITKRSPFL